jgi:hypothetical protein
MTKERDLTADLYVGLVDDSELQMVLQSVLPRGAQFRPGEVEYRTMADEWVLSLQYKNGKVTRAFSGPAMTEELKERVSAAIRQALLTPAGTKVCRWTMFSGRPIDGWWRYLDQFQIVSAPADAPRPGMLIAEHPFIVDFRFSDSSDGLIRQHRYIRTASDLTLVLNLLLTRGVTAPSNRHRMHWVWAPQGAEPPVMWTGEGYIISEFRYLVDDFPSTADFSALPEVPAAIYYDRPAGYSDVMRVPVELTRLLDAFSALVGDERERFLRACFWLHTASSVWHYSQSLHLSSLVNAVESLASVESTIGTRLSAREFLQGLIEFIRSRGQRPPAGAPTALFKAFMRKHAPGSPSGRQLDDIYAARSKITHGEMLLDYDQSAVPVGLTQTSALDREVGDSASILCRGALINWLWSHDSAASGHLLTQGLVRAKPPRPGTKSGFTVYVPGSKEAHEP